MTRSSLTQALIVLMCLYASVSAQCPLFYTDYNQQGNSFQLCSSGNVPSQYNDQVSSFIVPAGYSVQLYADYNNGGQVLGPYAQGSYNVPANFNDQLSSVVISRTQDPNCVTLYTDYNQQGNSFQLCSSGNVPAQYNDQVSSFVVPAGYSVQLYSDYNSGGQVQGPYTQGSYNVPASFNDQLSSVVISRVQAQNPNCATFYTDYNQQGNSFQLCSSGNVPAQYNDQVSSFVVPAGYSVQLYSDYNSGGQSQGPYTQGSYNVPASFNDQLSSVRITRARSCPTFYTDANLQGESFSLCSSGNVPGQYNDQISSFFVPAGYQVRLYADGGQRGQSIGPYRQGTYNTVPANFNDRISSVTVTRR